MNEQEIIELIRRVEYTDILQNKIVYMRNAITAAKREGAREEAIKLIEEIERIFEFDKIRSFGEKVAPGMWTQWDNLKKKHLGGDNNY